MSKKKKKIIIILVTVLTIIAIILGAGVYAVNHAFSILFKSLADTAPLPESVSQGENDTQSGSGEQANEEGTPKTDEVTPDGSENTPKNNTGAGGETPENGNTENNNDNKKSSNVRYSEEFIKQLEKKVSFSDKLKVLSIISSSLSSEHYIELMGMPSGGITDAEINRAYSILKSQLNSKDKQKIYEIYTKYVNLIE